ncbi:MAG: lipopolysaccharide biosynthesis protein [Paracoccaceae bacterium]
MNGRRFAGKSFASLCIKIGAAGLSFVMFVMLARALDATQFGQFGFAFSLATFLGVLGAMGQRNLVLRFVAVAVDQGDIKAARRVTRHSFARVLLGTALIVIALLGVSQVPSFRTQSHVLMAAACLTFSIGLAEFQPHIQRAAGSVLRALLPRDIAARLCMIAFASSVIFLDYQDLTAIDAILFFAACLIILTVLQSFSMDLTHPRHFFGRSYTKDSNHLEWQSAMWGFWGNSVLNASGRNLAIVAVGFLMPAVALSSFFAALRTAMVLELCLMAINIVAAPLLARHLQAGRKSEAQVLCQKVTLLIGIPTFGLYLMIVLYGDQILNLFGPGYDIAHKELIILATGYLISALAGPTAQVLEMGGQERTYFWMLLWTTGLSLLAIVALTPIFGTLAAAISISTSMICLKLWAYLHIYRHFGLSAGVVRLRTAV